VEALGAQPVLRRTLGIITSACFAVAFTGPTVAALFLPGILLASGGPAWWWMIPFILVFQFAVALVWSELASHYPLTGGVYQWAKFLGGDAVGALAGLSYVVALLVNVAIVGSVLNTILNQLFSGIDFSTRNTIIIAVLLSLATALFIATSVRLIARLNALGVAVELFFLFGLTILLLFHAHHPPTVVFETYGVGSGLHWIGPALIVIALLYALITGFETAACFSEETVDARAKSPRAIMIACVAVPVAFAAFTLSVMMATPDLKAAMADPAALIPNALNDAFGSTGEKLFLSVAIVAALSTTIALMAAGVRVIYGMARDELLPAHGFLTKLSNGTQQPIGAIAVVFVITLVPLVVADKIPVLLAGFVGMLVVPYILVLAFLLKRRLEGWPAEPSKFNLGGAGLALTVVSLVWTIGVFIDAAWPRVETNPDWGMLPAVEWFVGGVIVVWAIAMLVMRRQRGQSAPNADALRTPS
jgi:amino acid transporter